jgi:fructosamine-3-kinase
MADSTTVIRALRNHFAGAWTLRALHASSLCDTWRAERGMEVLFVKSVPAASAEILLAEADGLNALSATNTIRVPHVAGCWTSTDDHLALLTLEWLQLQPPDAQFGDRLGHLLGLLHAAKSPSQEDRFGWHRDNMLGGTPQRNHWSRQGGAAGWCEFFADERLGAMRERLANAGISSQLVRAVTGVIDVLPTLIEADDYQPHPSLIHGDLWSGNWGMLADGTPVIYDPAVSCSDAEAELAMMELFGATPAGFWRGYRETHELAGSYERRRGLYQLYHLLNHALLFGGSYVNQALSLAHSLA